MKNKILTVAICVYNEEKLIKRCVDSIPKRDDIEILIINDGSTDNTEQAIKALNLNNLVYIKNERNFGIGISRNIALDNASGKFLFFLDADDYVYTEAFNNIVDNLSTEFLCQYDIIKPFEIRPNGKKWFPRVHRGSFIKRSFIGDTRFPDLRGSEDTVFRRRLALKLPLILYKKDIVYFYNFPKENSLMAQKSYHAKYLVKFSERKKLFSKKRWY